MKRRFLRRRRYIVSKKFQLRYVKLILLVVFLTAFVTGFSIYYNSWVLLGEKLATVYPQGRLVALFNTVNIRLAFNLLIVIILCTAIGILTSHKIAGPLYRIKLFLGRMIEGDYSGRLRLRKNDELHDLAEIINRLAEKLEKEKKTVD